MCQLIGAHLIYCEHAHPLCAGRERVILPDSILSAVLGGCCPAGMALVKLAFADLLPSAPEPATPADPCEPGSAWPVLPTETCRRTLPLDHRPPPLAWFPSTRAMGLIDGDDWPEPWSQPPTVVPGTATAAGNEPEMLDTSLAFADLRIFWGPDICRLEYLLHLIETGRVCEAVS